MKPEEKIGKTIKILVDTFGNDAGDYVEILESDGKSIYYQDSKGKRCRFLNTQANVLFRFEEPSDEDVQAVLQEAAGTPLEPEEAVKEAAEEAGLKPAAKKPRKRAAKK